MFIGLSKFMKKRVKCQKPNICYNMIIIQITKSDNLEKALKQLKSKVIKTKQQRELFERKEFVKPSVKKRVKKLKAIYSQRVRQGLN